MRFARYTIFALVLGLPLAALAQSTAGSDQFVPLLPNVPGIQQLASGTTLSGFFSELYKICIGLAAVLAVLQLMFAGVQYMGSDSFTEKKDARERITLALVGLLLVLTPVIVFNIINPKILNLDINATSLQTSIQNIQNANAPAASAPTYNNPTNVVGNSNQPCTLSGNVAGHTEPGKACVANSPTGSNASANTQTWAVSCTKNCASFQNKCTSEGGTPSLVTSGGSGTLTCTHK